MIDEEAAAAGEKKSSRAKQIILGVVTLLIIVLVFGIVLPQMGDYDQAWAAIQDMSTTALIALGIATVVTIGVYVWPYQAALPGLRYGPGFVIRQTSFMISNVVPAGGAFGLATQYGMLASYRFDPAPSTAAIGITSVWNMFVTLSLPVIALVGLLVSGYTNSTAVLIAVAGLAAIAAMVIVFVIILRSETAARKIGDWGDRAVGWALGLVRKEADTDLGQALVDFRDSTVDVATSRWPRITATNFLQQIAQFSVLYLAVAGIQGSFTEPVTLAEAFAAFAFARIATFIPIPPGGLGTVDAAMIAILTGFGAANSDAMAATMVWRGLTYFPQVFIGIGTLVYWSRWKSKQPA